MKPKVIFEDEIILVIDKPAGMIVNRSKTVKSETLQSWLEKYLKTKGKGIGDRAGIVHRLDKETSGLLLVAKTKNAFENLQKQFKDRKVEKRYLALVHNKVEQKKGLIEVPISRSPFDRKKFGVFLGGRQANTRYKIKEIYKLADQYFTLLELIPKTGRTHQIRVHLKHIGHSVVSDEKYAGRKTAKKDRQWCPRQFLHAYYLGFLHPASQEKVCLTSLLPFELKKVLKTFIHFTA